MPTLCLNAFVSLLIFQTYIHPSQSLSCYKCFYDQGNPETYDCLNNPKVEENCTSTDGFETCETISAVSSRNYSRKIILRQCSGNIFGFYCEQGYPMIYEFVVAGTQAESETQIVNNNGSKTNVQYFELESYKFNLTQVRICFCRSQNCNDDVSEPWTSEPTIALQPSQEIDAVCHVCVSSREAPLLCPAVACTKYGKYLTKCLEVSGYSVHDESAVTIRKCGSGTEKSDGCVNVPSEKHYDAEGKEYILENSIICSCTGNKCNVPSFQHDPNQNQSQFIHQVHSIPLVITLTLIFHNLNTFLILPNHK